MKDQVNYTVIGAGHGGKAMTAHLALMGFNVTLFNRTAEHIAAIEARGGIELESFEGGPKGFGELSMVTANMEQAIQNADVIMVVVPSSAHSEIARLTAPFLKDGQVIILHPGRTFGVIEFRKGIIDNGCQADVTIAETETFIYASRSDGPAQARIFRIKDAVPLAALPATRTQSVLEIIKSAYPQYIDGIDVLHTGMNNMGAIFHPALALLNAGWIETTHGNFQFYIDGVSPAVARVLEVLDRERVTIAASLGVRARSAMDWLKMAYNVTAESLYEAIQNQTGYYGIRAPNTLNHRYIFEDVPMSLVPLATIGQLHGVSVRGMDSIIRLACIIHHTDYYRRGRTPERLGIDRLSVSELNHFVKEGTLNTY